MLHYRGTLDGSNEGITSIEFDSTVMNTHHVILLRGCISGNDISQSQLESGCYFELTEFVCILTSCLPSLTLSGQPYFSWIIWQLSSYLAVGWLCSKGNRAHIFPLWLTEHFWCTILFPWIMLCRVSSIQGWIKACCVRYACLHSKVSCDTELLQMEKIIFLYT